MDGLEAAGSVVLENGDSTIQAGSDHEIVIVVLIQIDPGDAGSGLAEFSWEQRLARKIVEWFFVMAVVQGCG